MTSQREPLRRVLGALFKAHPWHGVPIGRNSPELINVYLEMVPSDTIKYEIDKETGHLRVDRPQAYSNICPAMYGLVPQTLCAERVAALCMERTGRADIVGDGDPLDVCVLAEKIMPHGDLLLRAHPIGGLRMLDGGEADDKIVAVMQGDAAFGNFADISACPRALVDRLVHYFLTYKQDPRARHKTSTEITDVYGRDEAHEVVRRSREDYLERYANIDDLLVAAVRGQSPEGERGNQDE